MTHKYTNALVTETSPYLLQHAHNPVHWNPWSPELLERAQKEDKLLLISIGYAACHWCHVMEKECFEDEEVAAMMNEKFINIKIDREERPDIDHIYMDALQMMTGSGGWPLNIVALPNGKPFWGATYVEKDKWIKSLTELSNLYLKDKSKITEYADKLAEGIKSVNLVETKAEATSYSMQQLDAAVKNWSQHFDTTLGGNKQAPKFMMPANYNFLLHYGTATEDAAILEYTNTSLTKMAYGGVYDHVRGGFSRYATDTKWHIPHFEKMLYDNGQLTSLYAQAYAATNNPLYKKVVQETIAFTTRELMNKEYAFYSSLDADSYTEKGTLEEGAYYVWKKEKLQALLADRFEIFKDYYNISNYGLWEHQNYVLIRNKSDSEVAQKHKITQQQLTTTLEECKAILKEEQTNRKRPRLDDKILTSWNGLMLKGLIDAYTYLGDEEYLNIALKNAAFLKTKMIKKDHSIYRNHKNGKSNINGFLEDYATVIEAYIALYQVTFDESWLQIAKDLNDYCLNNFYDSSNGMFYFTSQEDTFVIRRTVETTDNVIPASNSIMAKNLFVLSKYFPNENYAQKASHMVKNVQQHFHENGGSYANWLQLALQQDLPFYEIAIVGKDYRKKAKELHASYTPNAILAGTAKTSKLELLQGRHDPNNTLIYVCQHGSCKLPQTEATAALQQLTYTD
ncbi:thioredoxin domain-containing protein [Cellulophaga sp. F20128]|uniref:thioredoxin domain-containing protein n=1 Tax=Cellulophaga sp. F20128 TaxID=2926413 RepID=UPI001FF15675|nr:thioredoxin domain-containing protein [Cellulophaga sp. F20128]MCK0155545.1 thioredoxin domain-containing protein [Cellulophaga sp. F20128]